MKNTSKRLWDIYDGEPFMENPYLGILGGNPRHGGAKRRKRGRKMAVRRRRRTARRVHRKGRKHNVRHVRRTSRAARRRRRNPWTVAGSVVPMVANRRRRRAKTTHRRRRRSSGRRSNPFGLSLPPMKSVAFAGVGFIGPSIVSSTLTSLAPSIVQQITGMGLIGKYVLRIGSVLGMSWLVKRFVGVNEGNMVLIGGGVNVALTLVNDFAPSLLPANPLAMYIPTVFPAAGTQGGMRQYVPLRPGLRGLAAVPNRFPQTAAAFPSVPYAQPGAAIGGSYGGVPARFKRF